MRIVSSSRFVLLFGLVSLTAPLVSREARGQIVVPGEGRRVEQVGDTFEDEKWKYTFHPPKSSENIDKQTRTPAGVSVNNRWYEGSMRGHPDVIERVATPEGGLPGSKWSMVMRTRESGIPGAGHGSVEQDDLIINVQGIVGTVPISREPSVVTRVYLPPYEEWEQRTGNSFGFRAALETHKPAKAKGLFRRGGGMEPETYWPGMFIYFNCKADGQKENSAMLLIRGGESGQDLRGPAVSPGWWTLGMSFTSDGQVHYFARKGVEGLSMKDHIASHYPYSYRAEGFSAFFYNVVNRDDGRTWSTSWIVDDPAMYFAR